MRSDLLHSLEIIRHIALLAVAIGCAYTDLARGKLYNAVTLGGLALGLALAYLLDANSPGFPHLRQAVFGAALGGAVFFVLYLLGGFDAGDVKMMAAVGALGGSVGFVIAGARLHRAGRRRNRRGHPHLAGASAARDSRAAPARCSASAECAAEEVPPSAMMPYGLAIGIGTVWAWWS